MRTISMSMSRALFGAVVVLASLPSTLVGVQGSVQGSTTNNERDLAILDIYKPRIVPPWLCGLQSETSICRNMDAIVMDQRHVASKASEWGVLVLMLQFQDHGDRPLVHPQDIEDLFNARFEEDLGSRTPTGLDLDGNNGNNDTVTVEQQQDGDGSSSNVWKTPVASVNTYFQANSFGKFDTKATIIPWTIVNRTAASCLGSNALVLECLHPILEDLDARHADTNQLFDWRHVDQNRDGVIDSLVLLHSEYHSPSVADVTSQVGDAHAAPYTASVPELGQWKSNVFDMQVATYSSMSAFAAIHDPAVMAQAQQLDGNVYRAPTIHLRTILIELMHSIGFPSLIPSNPREEGHGTGMYSLLSLPPPITEVPNTQTTSMLDPWSRYQLGWIQPIQIKGNGKFDSEPSSVSANTSVYILSKSYPENEYLLIENRDTLLFDAHLPTPGILIWHIDDRIRGNYRAGGPYQDGWPQNNRHYQVRVLQADAQYNLEQGNNFGDIGDYYRTGSATLGPSTGGRRLSSHHLRNNIFNQTGPIYPNTDSHQGGVVVATGIAIGNFTTDDTTKSFQVTGFSTDHDSVGVDLRGEVLKQYSNKCLVQVNVKYCDDLMDIFVDSRRHLEQSDDGCECYQWCAETGEATCCPYGTACNINCPRGRFVAGCVIPTKKQDDDDKHTEVEPPKYEPVSDDVTDPTQPPTSGAAGMLYRCGVAIVCVIPFLWI